MPQVIDLDKIGAARREAQDERPLIRFGGKDFQLPPEMPFAVIEAVGRLSAGPDGEPDNSALAESMSDIARALFGTRYREFLGLGPSVEDLTALLGEIAPAYGMNDEPDAEADKPAEEEPVEAL